MARNTGRRACYAYTPARKVSIFKIALQSTKRTRQHESCGYQHYQSPGGRAGAEGDDFPVRDHPTRGMLRVANGSPACTGRSLALPYLYSAVSALYNTRAAPRNHSSTVTRLASCTQRPCSRPRNKSSTAAGSLCGGLLRPGIGNAGPLFLMVKRFVFRVGRPNSEFLGPVSCCKMLVFTVKRFCFRVGRPKSKFLGTSFLR